MGGKTPKWGGFKFLTPPNHPMFNRVFHDFKPSILGGFQIPLLFGFFHPNVPNNPAVMARLIPFNVNVYDPLLMLGRIILVLTASVYLWLRTTRVGRMSQKAAISKDGYQNLKRIDPKIHAWNTSANLVIKLVP